MKNTAKELGITYNSGIIRTFRSLMDEVVYNWDYNTTPYITGEGVIVINNLAIGMDYTEYKTEVSQLYPGLYNKLREFLEMIQ